MSYTTFSFLLDFMQKVVIPFVALLLAAGYFNSNKYKHALETANTLAASTVQELNATKRNLQDKDKPGEWNAESRKLLKQWALEAVKKGLGEYYSILTNKLGEVGTTAVLSTIIEGKVEETRTPQFLEMATTLGPDKEPSNAAK
jgi:hypothetical protein